MNIQYQMPQMPQGGQWHDTTNIGYKPPQSPNVIGSSMPPPPSGQNGFGNGAPGGGQDWMKNPLVQKQLSGWDSARAANEGRWNAASSNLHRFETPYTPAVLAQMQASNAALAKGGADNAFRSEQSLLSMGGQGDASSLAAARDEANRIGTGAAVGANSALASQAALANNAAGMNVGTSILNALPETRADNYGGLLGLQQQNQWQNFMANGGNNGMPTPISPGQTNGRQSVGGKGPQQDQGFGFGQMPAAPPTSQPNVNKYDQQQYQVGGAWF